MTSPQSPTPIELALEYDTLLHRRVLANFASGVTVVTSIDEDGPVGMTCQSFFSLSLNPPLVAFAPALTSTSYPRIKSSGFFTINVLAEDQTELALQFAQSGADKWRGVEWTKGLRDTPLLKGAISSIECSLENEFVTGDHFLTVGLVRGLHHEPDRAPLLFFQGGFAMLGDQVP